MGERGRSPPTRRAASRASSSASLRRRHSLSLADAAVLERAGRGQRRLHVPAASGFRGRLEPERAHPAAERGLERSESPQEPVQPAATAVESAAVVAAEWTATAAAAAVEQQWSVVAAAVAAARRGQQLQGVRLQAADGQPPAAPAEQLCQAGRRTHGCRRTGTLLLFFKIIFLFKYYDKQALLLVTEISLQSIRTPATMPVRVSLKQNV